MNNHNSNVDITINEGRSDKSKSACKICLSEEEDFINDPLVSPWSWSGTMQYLHLNCLREWIKSKWRSVENDNCSSYVWENLFWELWKEKYPDFVTKNSRKIRLLEYKIPEEGDYIILESFQKHGDKKVRFLHVINFSNNKNKINIGRSNDWETRIVDISVSRHHSMIRKEKDGIWIWDSNSKFGTLLYKGIPSLLTHNDPQYVQWGSCLLIIQLEQPWWNWWLWILKPQEIEKGIKYKNYENRFPEEFRKIYDDANDDLIPVSGVFRSKKTKNVSTNPNNKVIPIEDTGEDFKRLSLNKLNNMNPVESNPTINSANQRGITATSVGGRNLQAFYSANKTRNRNHLQINTVIHEHDEEIKGTIDFRNRNRLREEEKEQRYYTQREENKHQRDESIDRLINEQNVDYEREEPVNPDSNNYAQEDNNEELK